MKPWSEDTKRTVTLVYGMTIGTTIIIAMLFVVLPALLEDGLLSPRDWMGIGTMTLFGLVASLPGTFKQFLGAGVDIVKDKINGRKNDD